MTKKELLKKLIPIMFAFFAMGAVDFVGIATNYVKADFELSDTMANLFTSMTFFWFLIFSIYLLHRLYNLPKMTQIYQNFLFLFLLINLLYPYTI